jgi:CTP-dependent riboflavin kinase
MKNKILTFILLSVFSTSMFAQQSGKEKELADKTIEQLNQSLKSANTLVVTGAIITGVGVTAIVIGIDKYSKESKEIKTVDYGQIPGIMDNQVQMNKTIPAAIVGLGGVILAGVGTNILVKGILKSNDVKVELVKFSYTSSIGVGLKVNF